MRDGERGRPAAGWRQWRLARCGEGCVALGLAVVGLPQVADRRFGDGEERGDRDTRWRSSYPLPAVPVIQPGPYRQCSLVAVLLVLWRDWRDGLWAGEEERYVCFGVSSVRSHEAPLHLWALRELTIAREPLPAVDVDDECEEGRPDDDDDNGAGCSPSCRDLRCTDMVSTPLRPDERGWPFTHHGGAGTSWILTMRIVSA